MSEGKIGNEHLGGGLKYKIDKNMNLAKWKFKHAGHEIIPIEVAETKQRCFLCVRCKEIYV
jgi:hypothetical protein